MEFKSPILAVDGLIVKNRNILMVRRTHYPFAGSWVLPGGHVDYGESVETAIGREMQEELGIGVIIKKLVGVYSDPERDPRYHVVTVAFLLEAETREIRLNDEASEFKFFPLDDIPPEIGFDHGNIINDLRRLLNKKRLRNDLYPT